MRTTININDKLLKQLKVRAAHTDQSVSEQIEEAVVNQLLEDSEDIAAYEAQKDQPATPFEDLLEEFRAEGLI